jgi:hypothetical protein
MVIAHTVPLFSQSWEIAWEKKYEGQGQGTTKSKDAFFDARQLPDGGYVFFGDSWSDATYEHHWYFLVCTDKNGEVIWAKEDSIRYYVNGRAIELDSGDGFIIGGGTKNIGSFLGAYAKLDSQGNKLWYKIDTCIAINSIRKSKSGGYLYTGGTLVDNTSSALWSNFARVGKFDENGKKLWSEDYEFSSSSLGNIAGWEVWEMSDSNAVFGGGAGIWEHFFVGFGKSKVWTTLRGGRESKNKVCKFVILPDGTYAIAGDWEQKDAFKIFGGGVFYTDPWLAISDLDKKTDNFDYLPAD